MVMLGVGVWMLVSVAVGVGVSVFIAVGILAYVGVGVSVGVSVGVIVEVQKLIGAVKKGAKYTLSLTESPVPVGFDGWVGPVMFPHQLLVASNVCSDSLKTLILELFAIQLLLMLIVPGFPDVLSVWKTLPMLEVAELLIKVLLVTLITPPF